MQRAAAVRTLFIACSPKKVLVALLEHAQSDNDDDDRSSRNRNRRWVRTIPRFSRHSSNIIIIINNSTTKMSVTSHPPIVDNPVRVSWTLRRRRRKKFLIVNPDFVMLRSELVQHAAILIHAAK
jgi:hypothetical protein